MQRLAWQPRESKVADCPNGNNYSGRVERAGSPRERSSYQVIHGPRRGPPLQTRGLGSGVRVPTHRCRSPLPSSGSRARAQRAGNPSAAPGAVAMMQEASRLNGSSERGPSSAELVGRSRDRSRLLGSRSGASRPLPGAQLASDYSRPTERAAAPDTRSRIRGAGADSPLPEPTPLLGKPGQISACWEPVRGSRHGRYNAGGVTARWLQRARPKLR
ncbi:hypothetical protein NDU88_007839 [Pleurodeles waltl]|uniref:Uncharacterized protein n=1 Tax=Pleurodeles waltl TaxID=8319 RepID=A0AAV7STL9_PLEWA|nr:hypothetical protein NDU88_007839 [Pleurodeles waltl]